MTDDQAPGDGSGWREDTQKAIDQASQALRTAWDASRESRGSALAAAKDATSALAAAIDEGITAARTSWGGDGDPEPGSTPPPPPPTPDTGETLVPPGQPNAAGEPGDPDEPGDASA